jgi:hypothetical protein
MWSELLQADIRSQVEAHHHPSMINDDTPLAFWMAVGATLRIQPV